MLNICQKIKQFKQLHRPIANRYLLETILWTFVTTTLITCSVLLKVEQSSKYSTFFHKLLLWDFFNNQWNFGEHQINADFIASFSSYLYMAILFSMIATFTLWLIQFKIIAKRVIEQTYYVNGELENNYFVFKNLLVVNVTRNITYIFCFTSGITFLIVIFYLLSYILIENIIKHNFNIFKFKIQHHSIKLEQFSSNIAIFAFEIAYFLFKNFLQIPSIDINVDDILKYFIPASSLALIIAIFLKSLFKNDIQKLLNNMNKIGTQVDNFQIFYHWEQHSCLTNFQFMKEIPSFMRQLLQNKATNRTEVIALLQKVDTIITILRQKLTETTIKVNEYNYLCYHIFYEISNEQQLDKLSEIIEKKIKNKNKLKKIIKKVIK